MTLDTTIGLFDVLHHAKYPDNTVFNLITTHHRWDDLHHFDCNLVKGKISYSIQRALTSLSAMRESSCLIYVALP